MIYEKGSFFENFTKTSRQEQLIFISLGGMHEFLMNGGDC